MTVIEILICCCVPNFIKVGSRVRPPDAHNCRMFNAPLQRPLRRCNGRCHGNRIMADMSGHVEMRWPVFRLNRSIDRRVIAFQQFPIWRPSAILNWIWSFWTTHEVNYAVRLLCQNMVSIRSSPLEILRFYDFASLAGKCLTTPTFGVFGVLNPLKLWVVIKTPKRHILGWVRII